RSIPVIGPLFVQQGSLARRAVVPRRRGRPTPPACRHCLSTSGSGAARSPREEDKNMSKGLAFATGDYVVYPTHGVGKVVGVETQKIAGHELQLFVITFDKDRMTLRVPVSKAKSSGLRKLSSRKVMDAAMETLK